MNKQIKSHLFLLMAFASLTGVFLVIQIVFRTTKQKGAGGRIEVATGREMLDSPDRAATARKIASARSTESVPYLIPFLKDPDPEVRAAVAEAIGAIRDPRGLPDLLFRLDAEEDRVPRAAIARAIGSMGNPDVIPKLTKRLNDPEAMVRLAVVEALGTWTNKPAITALADATADTNNSVRAKAADYLVAAGGQAIPAISEAMGGGGVHTTVFRIGTVGRIRTPQTVPALMDALSRHDPDTRGVSRPAKPSPVRAAVLDAMRPFGEEAVSNLVAAVVNVPGQLGMKTFAADFFVANNSASGMEAVTRRLLGWKAMWSETEWDLWTDMFAGMGGDKARDALQRLKTHYAEIASVLPDAPKAGERRVIPPPKPTDASGYTGELSLVVEQAVFGGDKPGPRRGNLDLELTCDAGAWDRVWGCQSYNRGIHEGLVRESKTTPDTFTLSVGVLVGDDPWMPGGFADLRMKLQRPASGAGAIQGTYEGTFKGHPISGKIRGEERPRRPVIVRDFAPLLPEEHPRILFRRHELAAIRERARTPFGKAFKEAAFRNGDELSLAMLHQITGDPSFADSAMRIVEGYGDDIETVEGSGSGGFGHRLVRVMLAYDLCYDAWPEAFKQRLRDRLRVTLPVLQKYIAITGANYDPSCNYYGPGRGAPAIAALVLWGEKGTEPSPPPDPTGKPIAIEPLSAQPTLTPDSPVGEFSPGVCPRQRWSFAGPAPFGLTTLSEDMLLDQGRLHPLPGVARPCVGVIADGDAVKMQDYTFAFGPLPAQRVTEKGLDLSPLLSGAPENTFVLFTFLRVTNEQTVAVVPDGATSLWLGGVRLKADSYYRIRSGIYPFLATCSAQGREATIAPRLVSPDAPEMAVRNADRDFRLALWKADVADWQRYGGADPFWMRCANVGYWHMFAHYRRGIGDGGFQAETGSYADIASWFPLVYASVWPRCFGRLPSPYPDVSHLVPRRMMAVHFPEAGEAPQAIKLNSSHGLRAEHCAAIFPALPEPFRGPVLWGWNRVCGTNGATGLEGILAGSRDLWGSPLGATLTFLNYPAGMEPVHPAKAMPLTWEAKTFGYYCFRSGWAGRDEFISQVFLKAFAIGGWNDPNAGAFRIFGLGKPWVTGNASKAGIRQFEPVVVLLPEWVEGTETDAAKVHAEKKAKAIASVLPPERLTSTKAKPEQPKAIFAQNALSHLLYYKAEPDGSGVLSLDYRDVYSAAQKDAKPSGVTGMRSLGFDYSGKSGSPFLLAMADRIEGQVDKVWIWPLPEGCLSNTTVKGNTFVVKQGDATMRGTFLSPLNVQVEATSESIVHQGARLFDKTLDRIKAKGEGSFLVVITIQRGDAPPVAIQGAGMEARATVGRQTVRFDGQKIVLEPAP
jgi:hypothetical protein